MKFQDVAACLLLAGGLAAPASAKAEIHIAVAGPMSGQFAAFGDQIRAGAEQAVVDINLAGGVLGEPLVLDIVDDACEASQAEAVANQLVGKGVAMVAGHVCFAASMAASEIYSKAGIVQISPATSLPKFTDMRPGAGIYRLAPRDDQQAKVAGRLLAEDFTNADVAFLHDKTAYGKGLVDAVRAEMNRFGKVETFYQGFDAGEDDYRILVSRLALEGADVVYLGGYHPEAGLIKLEMNRQGLSTIMVAGDALVTEEFWSVAGPAGTGTLFTYPPDPRASPAAAPVIAALEARGETADGFALSAYAAVQTWAQAVEAAGSSGFETVVAALDNGTFSTILGDTAFDGNGDSSLPSYVVYEWRDGAPQQR